jgi:hypothetical protein
MSKAKRLRAQRKATPPPIGKNQTTGRRVWLVGGGVLLVAAIVGIAIATTRSGGTAPAKPVNETAMPSLQNGPPPWGTATADLANRLQVLGLPALPQEGSVLHIHQHIDVFVDGKPVTVPAGIGINEGSFISPIHTHDTSGVIHVESPTREDFTLGQVVAIWGVRFTATRLGGYISTASHPIRFYVGGKPVTSDPHKIVLRAHQDIAVVVGKPPKHVPSSYSFPEGE